MKSLLLFLGAIGMSAMPAQIISVGPTHGRQIALTFDAGADTGYARRILTILERNHVHATFGMTGRWALQNASLVRRMNYDHDQLMNHTYDHRSFTGISTRTSPLSSQERRREIEQTDAIIRRVTGHSTKPYFRPPFGDYDSTTLNLLRALGYRYMVMWTVDSLGWNHLPASAILSRCLSAAQPGAIVLMHVGIQSKDAAALQPLITALMARRYDLVTVSTLINNHVPASSRASERNSSL